MSAVGQDQVPANRAQEGAPEGPSSRASTGSFWSRHKVTILTVGGAVVGGAVAAALIATGIGASLIALPIIAKFAWAVASGMMIGGLSGFGLGLFILDSRKDASKQPPLSEDHLQAPKFFDGDDQEEFTVKFHHDPILGNQKAENAFSKPSESENLAKMESQPEQTYKLGRSKHTRKIDTRSLPSYYGSKNRSNEPAAQPDAPSLSNASQSLASDQALTQALAQVKVESATINKVAGWVARGYEGQIPTPEEVQRQADAQERIDQEEIFAKQVREQQKKLQQQNRSKTESPVTPEPSPLKNESVQKTEEHPEGWLFTGLPVKTEKPNLPISESAANLASSTSRPALSLNDQLNLARREHGRDMQNVTPKNDDGTQTPNILSNSFGGDFLPMAKDWFHPVINPQKPKEPENDLSNKSMLTQKEPEKLPSFPEKTVVLARKPIH